MTTTEDRPTLPERYARAIDSTHLELRMDERCSVDMLIAAGWCAESLGTALYRLRAEFDTVRVAIQRNARAEAERAAAARHSIEALTEAARLEDARGIEGPTWAPYYRWQAERVLQDAAHASLVDRLLVLSQLKTLEQTKRELGRFASRLATLERFMQPDDVVMRIAGRALDAWLDPLCPVCGGTGALGQLGAPRAICNEPPNGCGGTRLRSVRLGQDNASHEFGRLLLTEMDRKADHVTGQMRRFLSQRT